MSPERKEMIQAFECWRDDKDLSSAVKSSNASAIRAGLL
jgi:hypothetical protein